MEFTEIITSTLSCYSPCGNWIASWEDGRILTVYDAFSLEATYKTALPPFKKDISMQWLVDFVILNDTSSVVVLDLTGKLVAQMTEPIEIVNVSTFYSWIVVQLEVSFGCKLYNLKNAEARFIRNVRCARASGNDLLVLLTDGTITCFDRELKAVKSAPLNCQAFQVNNDTIYGYDSSSFKLVVSDVEVFAIKSVPFMMDCGVSRLISSGDHLATCILEDGTILLLNCLLNKVISRVIVGGSCVVFKETLTEADTHKYEASHSPIKQCMKFSSCSMGSDEHWSLHRTNFVYVFKRNSLIACLQQLSPVIATIWHPTLHILTILCQEPTCMYVWQPRGAHCIPVPFDKLYAKEVMWHPDGECALLIGQQGFCVVVPEESMMATVHKDAQIPKSVQEEQRLSV
jgi:hypothetical protein